MVAEESNPVTTRKRTRKLPPKKLTAAAVKKAASLDIPKRRGGPPAKYDWPKVRTHFIEQVEPISLKDVAEVYGVPYGMTRDRCSAERWQYLRAEYQANLARSVSRQRIKTQLAESENFDDQSLKAAKTGQSLIAGRMAQIAAVFTAQQGNFNAALARLKAGQHVDKAELYSAINYKELNELAAALERFQSVGRRALGTDFQMQATENTPEDEGLDITTEMGKDDIDRMAALMAAMERAGLNQLAIENGSNEKDDEIVDAEVVEQ